MIHDAPAAYEMMKPYVLAIVEMEEGCRVTSQIVDVDPATVKIGMQVNAAFRKLGSEGEAGVIHHGHKVPARRVALVRRSRPFGRNAYIHRWILLSIDEIT